MILKNKKGIVVSSLMKLILVVLALVVLLLILYGAKQSIGDVISNIFG